MPRFRRWWSLTRATTSGPCSANSSTNASVLTSALSRITPSKSKQIAAIGGALVTVLLVVEVLDHAQEALAHVDVVGRDQLAPRLRRVRVRRHRVVSGSRTLRRTIVDRDRAPEDLL